MNNELIKCPRCDNSNLIDYGNIIECPKCNLEFHKKDLLSLKQDEILAISEKMDFIKSIKNKNSE